jgi:hypothetical protein
MQPNNINRPYSDNSVRLKSAVIQTKPAYHRPAYGYKESSFWLNLKKT